MIKEYNRNIDFLRFLFSIIIIVFHMYNNNLFSLYGNMEEYRLFAINTRRSYVIVELFFIISGYYLYNTNFDKISFGKFFYKKLIRLYPLFFIATLIEFYPNYSIDTIMRLLLQQNTGLSLQIGGINWFVSALFWTLMFYFALIKITNKKYIFFIISLIVYFSYVFIVNYGFVRDVRGYIFSIGIVRGVAGVGLGYLLHYVCENTNENLLAKLRKKTSYIIISSMEIGLLYFLIYAFTTNNISYNNNLIFVIAFLPIIYSFVFKLGFVSKILDNDLSYKLGAYSYALYVLQQSSFNISVKLLRAIEIYNFYLGSAITLLICIIVSVSLHHIVKHLINLFKLNN